MSEQEKSFDLISDDSECIIAESNTIANNVVINNMVVNDTHDKNENTLENNFGNTNSKKRFPINDENKYKRPSPLYNNK